MKYIFKDLGPLEAGKFIEVGLSTSANVRFMDNENFEKFKNKETHDFIGGFVRFTPYTIKLPVAAHWIVVVDLGGMPGTVNASVTVHQTEKKLKKTPFT